MHVPKRTRRWSSRSVVRMLLTVALALCGSTLNAQPAEVRTWTDATGKYKTEARFVDVKDDVVFLRRSDGKVVGLALDQLSSADQAYVRSRAKNPAGGEPDPSGGQSLGPAPEGSVTVVATGVGLNPEAATQNAFSNAIEQVVGVSAPNNQSRGQAGEDVSVSSARLQCDDSSPLSKTTNVLAISRRFYQA